METVALFGQTRHGLGRLWLRAWAWLGGIAEPAARWGMALAGLPVWIFLCWYSFRYSYLEGVHVPEKLSLVKDSMGRHMLGILALALAWGGAAAAGKALLQGSAGTGGEEFGSAGCGLASGLGPVVDLFLR